MKEKTKEKTTVTLTMTLPGVLTYCFFSNFAVACMVFMHAGFALLALYTLGFSVLYSAIMTVLFSIFSTWVQNDINKNHTIKLPFVGVILPKDIDEIIE